MPAFPYTHESSSGAGATSTGRSGPRIPLVVVPDVPGEIDPGAPPKLRVREALSQIVAHAIRRGDAARGRRALVLSNVIEPGRSSSTPPT